MPVAFGGGQIRIPAGIRPGAGHRRRGAAGRPAGAAGAASRAAAASGPGRFDPATPLGRGRPGFGHAPRHVAFALAAAPRRIRGRLSRPPGRLPAAADGPRQARGGPPWCPAAIRRPPVARLAARAPSCGNPARPARCWCATMRFRRVGDATAVALGPACQMKFAIRNMHSGWEGRAR